MDFCFSISRPITTTPKILVIMFSNALFTVAFTLLSALVLGFDYGWTEIICAILFSCINTFLCMYVLCTGKYLEFKF